MSDIQYHQTRLEENFECLLASEPHDGRTQRACLYIIMSCCHELRLDLRDYLKEKFTKQHKAEMIMNESSQSFRCRDCGETFTTPQARNGHMAHCKQKGGVDHA